jgi:hypothetical protein
MLMGDIDKVYYHLSEFARSEEYFIWSIQWRDDPVYDKIRSEPEYLKIIGEIEENYHKQHEEVRQGLEENDLL